MPVRDPRLLQSVSDIVLGGPRIVTGVVVSPILRRRNNRHGAIDAEIAAAMPGDEQVEEPELGFTRAVAVDAPVEDVWPWLAVAGHE